LEKKQIPKGYPQEQGKVEHVRFADNGFRVLLLNQLSYDPWNIGAWCMR
jgi:hypothetical protein